ncbi:Uncharacterised protein [Agrobacterium tumefaciens]|nr:Uncharacterised protein [Agrobacterium tumefaciens]
MTAVAVNGTARHFAAVYPLNHRGLVLAECADAQRLATTFHGMFAQIFAANAFRKHQLMSEVCRYEHRMTEHLAERFETRCGVHGIAEIGDLVMIDAYFRRDDRPAMDGEAQARHFAKAGEPHVPVAFNRRLNIEYAAHAGRRLIAI